MSALNKHCEILNVTLGDDFVDLGSLDCISKKRIERSDSTTQLLNFKTALSTVFLAATCVWSFSFSADSTNAACVITQVQSESDTQQTETPESERDIQIKELIQQLGDKHYVVRDEAESELLKIGGPAIESLRIATTLSGTDAPDGEIQLRATRLLILIEREEREQKIRLFLDGKDPKLNLDGWIEFSKIFESESTDRQLRRIFVDMYQAQPKLFAAIKKGKHELESTYQFVSKQSLRSNSNSNATQAAGTMNALMFVAALEFPGADESGKSERISISQNDLRRLKSVVTQSQMVTYVNNCGSRQQIEKLISNWLTAIPRKDAGSAGHILAVIKAYKMDSQIEAVIEFANDKKLPAQTRVTAIELLASLGNAVHLPNLASLLQDSTIVGSYLPQINLPDSENSGEPNFKNSEPPPLMQVQIRDLALIAAIRICNLKTNEFGFQPKCVSKNRFVRNRAGFYSQDSREAAFKKWNSRN